jgi:hypothetical protein
VTTTLPPSLAAEVAAERDRLNGAVSRAFVAESASRRRDPHHLGISSIGSCRRAVAYALAKVPVSDHHPEEEGRAANLGTWEHNGLLPRLADQLPGARTEVKVTATVAGIVIPGSIDLNDPGDDNLHVTGNVIDLKTVGEWRLSGVRWLGAAYYHHRMQVGTYGLARLQAGRPPRYVSWLYLDRANGDQYIIVERFTNGLMLEVIDRVTELVRWADTPDEAPRDERGPGLSIICDKCPWLRECWGPDAVPERTGPQRVYTKPEIEQALLDYADARDREGQAKKDKKFAEAQFEGNPHGTYGRVSYGRGPDRSEDDPWGSLRLIKSMGIAPPQTTKRGSLKVKIVKGPDQ